MLKDCFDENQLELQRRDDLELMRNRQRIAFLDEVTTADVGSFIARTLDQYRDILSHNGTPDIVHHLDGSRKKPTVLDIGCGAGLALVDLRELFPNARLVGIDIRNSARNSLKIDLQSPKQEKYLASNVGDLHTLYSVEFYQEISLNSHKVVPEGCDLITAVAAFPEPEDPQRSHAPQMKYFYDRLRNGGIALVQYNPLQQQWNEARNCLENAGLPYQFIAASSEVLRRHSLNAGNGILGTLVLGPKIG